MAAPAEIIDLINRFEQHLDAYKAGQYNETQLRRDFLDPFFKALGWDIDNTAGYAEAYRDVIHEDQIRVGGAVKAPDYCFRIGSTRKFFLEAKKPSVCIKEEIPPAYQLRRYGWNAKLPLSILSDFEELAIYDCRFKPHKDDKASLGRIFYCTFKEYAQHWDHLAGIFSRDAVLRGSFDKFAETNKAKRGTSEVDSDFLATIEGWRKELAQNLALRNPRLTQRELNFAVQRLIDRVIFLRICEDRGIEDYGRLRGLGNGDRIYPRLCQLFEAADDRYNSGLFHFKNEPDRHEAPDELTLGLEVDDRLLRDILKNLYYPDSPYEFSILSADILGQVYEQFLGKVIRLTEGHRAVVEEKPEVKKAGGVYYTPTYIVDYIVRQTVGKLLEECSSRRKEALTEGEESEKAGKRESAPATAAIALSPAHSPTFPPAASPRDAARILDRVSRLRILDPACGSGSFLIGAYQHLLDWHLQFYTANEPERWARGRMPALVQTTRGWRLTIAERKRILLNNLHGVDIDSQAVEVTKLSLLLKVLEGETHQSLAPLFSIFHERALPDLGDNIKCGNSLIGPDFYQQAELPLLTDEERYRINVFEWQAEFPNVFRRKSSSGELREAAAPLDYTTPGVPLHGSYSYKRKKGEMAAPPPLQMEPEWEGGFDAVIGNPPYIFTRNQGIDERQKTYFYSHYQHQSAQLNTFGIFLERCHGLLRPRGSLGFITPNNWLTIDSFTPLRRFVVRATCELKLVNILDRVFAAADVDTAIVHFRKGEPDGLIVAEISHQRETFSRRVELSEIKEPELIIQIGLLKDSTSKEVIGKIEARGRPLWEFCTVSTGLKAYQTGKGRPPQKNSHKEGRVFHATRKLNQTYGKYLDGVDVARYCLGWSGEYLSYGDWLAEPRRSVPFSGERLLVRQIPSRPPYLVHGVFTDKEHYNDINSMVVFAPAKPVSLKYLLGIINSRLLSHWFLKTFDKLQRKIFPQFKVKELARFLISPINFSDPADKTRHDRMVSLVEQILALHRQLAAARTPQEKTALERQITATDKQIDRLVYELYELNEQDIGIVEAASG